MDDFNLVYSANYLSWRKYFTDLCGRTYKWLPHRQEDIVAEAMACPMKYRERIESDWKKNGGELAALLFGYIRMELRAAAQKVWREESCWVPLVDETEVNGNDRTYKRPTARVWPEQEEIVFLKQMLDYCGRLPDDERSVMMLIFDRATLADMCRELRLSAAEIERRHLRGARRLRESLPPAA